MIASLLVQTSSGAPGILGNPLIMMIIVMGIFYVMLILPQQRQRKKTQAMLRDSIDALVNLDAGLADKVCARDSEVDQMKRDNRKRAESIVREDASRVPGIMNLLAVSRSLERIADHATNIAEDVIYMVQGRIIRHGTGLDGG